MTYKFDGYNYILRLSRGEKLMDNLVAFAREQELGSAWLNGLGGAQWAELGYYNLETREYEWQRFDQLLEITSLQGNLAWVDDETVWHVHGSFSDREFRGIGGHVKELEVGGTCELFIHTRFNGETMRRVQDDDVGLKLLDV